MATLIHSTLNDDLTTLIYILSRILRFPAIAIDVPLHSECIKSECGFDPEMPK